MLCSAFLWSCSSDEKVYDGKQVSQFVTDVTEVYAEPGKTNASELTVWLGKPAEGKTFVPVRLKSATRPGSMFINGFNYAVGDIFNIEVPGGALKASARIQTSPNYYNKNGVDSLVFELADPYFGQGGTMYLKNTTSMAFKSYCTMTASDMGGLVGDYVDTQTSYPINYHITATMADTVVIDSLGMALMAIGGLTPIDVYPVKFVVDYSKVPVTVTVAGNQKFYTTRLDGRDVEVWARATNFEGKQAYSGELDFCSKRFTLYIERYIPTDPTAQSGAWEIIMDPK